MNIELLPMFSTIIQLTRNEDAQSYQVEVI